MRLLAILATVLVLGMIAATVWTITGSPGLVDEIPATTFVTPPTPAPTPVIISVDEGEGVKEIGDMLEDEGVIESAIQFRVLVELLGYDRLLQAGEYEFDSNTPALHVVYRMRRGIVSPLFVAVVEGWRLEEIADALDVHIEPNGVGVIVRAHHSCMGCRGVRQAGSEMVTSAMLGSMKENPETRAEFLALAGE
ncbi:hypothetical protein LCGC14_2872830 [marine sediment metagenome]|uniref:GTP cyclohydrolase I n=1 Tax=marine sediment metagenome TaxID=412755 RepID=A0A0F9ATM1_9ZZZZ